MNEVNKKQSELKDNTNLQKFPKKLKVSKSKSFEITNDTSLVKQFEVNSNLYLYQSICHTTEFTKLSLLK